MHGQRGQATIDYVALLAVLALLFGAAAAIAAGGAPGVTNAVMGQVRRALCIVSGRACAAERRLPCVVASRRDAQHVAVTIVVVRLDGDRYVLREDLSDDTVRLTIAHRGGAGGEIAEGSRAQIKAGGRTIGTEREVHAAAEAVLGHGEVFIADNEREAEAILRELRGSGPLGIGRDGPQPRETFVEGGIRALSRVGIGEPAAQASLESLGETVIGARRNRVTGEATISLESSGTALGLLSVVGVGPTGSLDRRANLALKLDRDRRPIELSLTASGTIAAGAAASPVLARALPRGGAAGAGAGSADLAGRRWELEVRLDLTAPAVAAAWSAVRRNPASPAAIRTLGAMLATQGHLDVRSYATTSETEGAAASIAHVLKVGGEVDRTTDTARLLSASSRPPGGVWEQRFDCVEPRTAVPA
jgi:hypothetical protein